MENGPQGDTSASKLGSPSQNAYFIGRLRCEEALYRFFRSSGTRIHVETSNIEEARIKHCGVRSCELHDG